MHSEPQLVHVTLLQWQSLEHTQDFSQDFSGCPERFSNYCMGGSTRSNVLIVSVVHWTLHSAHYLRSFSTHFSVSSLVFVSQQLPLCLSSCLCVSAAVFVSQQLFLCLSSCFCVSAAVSVSQQLPLCLSICLCVSAAASVSQQLSLCLSSWLCVSASVFVSQQLSLCLSKLGSFFTILCRVSTHLKVSGG